MENVRNNQLHYKGNRFSDTVKKISSYLYIRGGKSLYNFLQANMVLPELSGLKRYMNNELNIVKGNVLRFDELHQYLAAHEYPFEIHVFEDGSRITSKVEFCPDTNTFIGLDSPFDPLTGLPFVNFHKANSASNIYNSITYFTDNSFTAIDVMNRINYMKEEFINYGINFLRYGSHGDARMFNAQKKPEFSLVFNFKQL